MSRFHIFTTSVTPATKMVSIDIERDDGKGKVRSYEFPAEIALEIASDLIGAYFALRDGDPAKHGFTKNEI